MSSELVEAKSKKASLFGAYEQVQSQASSLVSFSLRWKDLEDKYDSIHEELESRSAKLLESEKLLQERVRQVESREEGLCLVQRKMEECQSEIDRKEKELGMVRKRLEECCEELKKQESQLFETRRALNDCLQLIEEKERELSSLMQLIEKCSRNYNSKTEELHCLQQELDLREKRLGSFQNSPEVVVCPDPEFSDFEKHKEQDCFAVDQIWACYDKLDGMPRYYARIKKVFSQEFKLQFVWLEADPDNQDEIDWCPKDLPVACGKYKNGGTEETTNKLMFSHRMQSDKRGREGVYLIYPRKGEVWALFKNWDIKWNAETQKFLPFAYDYVEVLSDFVEDSGIKVVCLSKVEGFVCLFQRADVHEDGDDSSFEIPPRELYRFSHRIPSFMMTGREREGVPAGSFELDPAAVDLNEPVTSVENKRLDGEMGHVGPATPRGSWNPEGVSEPGARRIVLGLPSSTTSASSSRKQGIPHKEAESSNEVVLEQAVSQGDRSHSLFQNVHTTRKRKLKNKEGEISDMRRRSSRSFREICTSEGTQKRC